MNRRWTTVVLAIGLGLGGYALGQSAVPTAVRTAATITDDGRNTISAFIKTQIIKLSSAKVSDRDTARDALMGAVVGGEPGPSAQFVDAYAQALNDALLPLLDDPSMLMRMNAAIIAGRVAERTQSLRLKPVVIKLLADKSDPVVLWGAKAARPLLLAQMRLQVSPDDALLTGLVPAIQDNLSGPVAHAGYDVLRLNLFQDRDAVSDAMLQATVPHIQKLLAQRIAQYKDDIPDVPVNDTLATSFLVDGKVWRAQTTEQRTATVQLIVDMLSYGSRRAAALSAKGDQDAREGVVQTLNWVGSAVRVVADANSKPTLANAASAVMNLEASNDGAAITQACDGLVSVLSTEFTGVKAPAVAASE
jgi:hypothetical protein